MASSCGRFMRRASGTLNSAVRSNLRPAPAAKPAGFAAPPKSATSSPLSFSVLRVRQELGGVQSLLPLHSAVSAARMTSCLSTKSSSCRALSQGT